MNKLHLVPQLQGSLLDTVWSETDLELFKTEYLELLIEGKTGTHKVKTKGLLKKSENALDIMVHFHEQLKKMYENAVRDAEEIAILNEKLRNNKPIIKSLAKNRRNLESEVMEVTKALKSSQVKNSEKKKNLKARDDRLLEAKEYSKQKKIEYDGILKNE